VASLYDISQGYQGPNPWLTPQYNLAEEVPRHELMRASKLGESPGALYRYLTRKDQASEYLEATAYAGTALHRLEQAKKVAADPNIQTEIFVYDPETQISGHVDVVYPGNIPSDIKSVSSKRFREVREKGAFPKHISQMNFYMYAMGAQRGMLEYVSRQNLNQRETVHLKFDPELLQEDIEKLQRTRARIARDVLQGRLEPWQLPKGASLETLLKEAAGAREKAIADAQRIPFLERVYGQDMAYLGSLRWNKPYNPQDGLHPGSEGLGTQMVRAHSDFGSGWIGRAGGWLRGLFRRPSPVTQVISPPLKTKGVTGFETFIEAASALEQAYKSVGEAFALGPKGLKRLDVAKAELDRLEAITTKKWGRYGQAIFEEAEKETLLTKLAKKQRTLFSKPRGGAATGVGRRVAEAGRRQPEVDPFALTQGLKFPGMPDEGLGPQMRETITEFKKNFASRWDPLRKLATKLYKGLDEKAAFRKLTGSSEFQKALESAAIEDPFMSFGASGTIQLMKGSFKGQEFKFVRKLGTLGEQEVAAMKAVEGTVGPSVYSASETAINMEYFAGELLGDVSQSRLAEISGVKNRARGVFEELHKAGFTHGDPNFGNLMLVRTPEGGREIGLLDFGRARKLSSFGTKADLKQEMLNDISFVTTGLEEKLGQKTTGFSFGGGIVPQTQKSREMFRKRSTEAVGVGFRQAHNAGRGHGSFASTKSK